MRKILNAAIILTLCSCSLIRTKNRTISSINDLNDIHSYQDSCSIIENKDNRSFYELSKSLILIIDSSDKLTLINLNDCSTNHVNLSVNEKIKIVKKIGNTFLLNSTHGRFISVKNKIHIHDIGFPVSSFIVKDNVISLYSSFDHGRFCTFKELEKNLEFRDKSCLLVHQTIEITQLK